MKLALKLDDKLKTFFSYFAEKMSFDISRNLSPKKTVCMKMSDPILWAEIEKIYFKMSSAEIFPSVLSVIK